MRKKNGLERVIKFIETGEEIDLDDPSYEKPIVVESKNRRYVQFYQDKKGKTYVRDLSGNGGIILRTYVNKSIEIRMKKLPFNENGFSEYLENGDRVLLDTQEIKESKPSFFYFEEETKEKK